MASTWMVSLCVSYTLWLSCLGLPVDRGTTTIEPVRNKTAEEWDTGLEYDRYLKEVVQVLEDDAEFRKKMESANPDHFKTGEIAKELNFVSHNIRSKLDEIKRRELVRLRALIKEKMDRNEHHELKLPEHLNTHEDGFNEEDLKRLIKQTSADLQAADEARRKEFKEYEMDKEHDRREKLKTMDDRARKEEERKFDEEKKKHQDHPAVHEPGSKAQLEEVWEETDGLPKEDFEPKTFFRLHDLNQDGVLDQAELEALFQKELDKVYDPNKPEDDMRERMEEMARMREHVMKEIDTNHDGMISFEEWMAQVNKREFQQDEGWDTLDKQPQFSENELQEYERQLQMHQQNYQYPPQQGYNQGGYQGGQPAQPGYPPGPPSGYPQYPGGQGPPQGYNPPSGYGGPNQGGYNQYPGGQPTFQQGQPQQPSQYGNNPSSTQAPYGSQGNPNQYQQQHGSGGANQQNNQGNQNYNQYGSGNQNQNYNQGNQNQQYNSGSQQNQQYNSGNQNQQYNTGNQNQQPNSGNQNYNQGTQSNQQPQSSQWSNNASPSQSGSPGSSTYDPRNDPNSIHSARVVGGQKP